MSPNRLADEKSPYLLQHAGNPVDWYPWGEEAFEAAHELDRPIFLSIGYATCHWCHVMERESFEDEQVARLMNETFVNVKVDREERPDIDGIYMAVAQMATGQGGWPLTVVMTPDRLPFFSGTYFPRESRFGRPGMVDLVPRIGQLWKTRRRDLLESAASIQRQLQKLGAIPPAETSPGPETLARGFDELAREFDPTHGGFGRAPKFPTPHRLMFLLRYWRRTGNEEALQIVERTLDAMRDGGVFDQLGFGFHRYSTDRAWLLPHFEKMLYDQALLVGAYLRGAIVIGAPQYRLVVEETIDYVVSVLRHPEGGFCSAEDADSPDDEGNSVEGWYSTWTPDEIRDALSEVDAATVDGLIEWYGITDDGNFEGRSIPNRLHARGQLVRSPELDAARRAVLGARSRRHRPGLDDKILTEWNALFLASLAQAGAVFGRQDWLDVAIANGEFLLRELRDDRGRWSRSWQADGTPQARHAALAADHAALVDAFTRLAEATGQARWIGEAVRTADTMLDWFWDPEHGALYTTAEDAEALVVRQKDVSDGATPSANSSAAIALYRLAALTGERRYAHQADRILQFLAPLIETSPGQHLNALVAADLRRRGLTEVVIVGDRPELVRLAQAIWRPDTVLAWGEPYDSPLWADRRDGFAYVCRDYSCQAPQDTLQGFAEALTGRKVTIADGRIVTSAPDA